MSIYHEISNAVDAQFLQWANKVRRGEMLEDISPVLYPSEDQPFLIKSYGYELEYPINPDLTKLPSITLANGGYREGVDGLTQEDSTIFTLVVYAIVKALPAAEAYDNKARNLVDSGNDVRAAMDRLHIFLLTAGLSADDAYVDTVKLARGRSGEGKFTKVEMLQFFFDFHIKRELPSVF